ncbi:terminase small subunit [Enterobacter sichuanensis]|uniref:terminase small subunit n=1 Tax=Enterobacter sichuanensis TaxID=2071710 RepID=UPI0021CFDA62|nr:terminase small subunit [Enterobacter sichuanensis]
MAKPDWGELQQRFLSEHATTGVSPKEWCEAQGLNYATARRYIKKLTAKTAQKSAQKKVRTAQKDKSADELVDDDGLTAQQRLFVAEYLKDNNATRAAIRAGYSKKTAREQSSRLLSNVKVAQAITRQQKASIARTLGSADEVLAQMWQLATFDANQLSQYRRGACRYCWGFGHQYQWRDMMEFEEKRLEATERDKREPVDVGGYGYDHNREPNPECPRCNGDGTQASGEQKSSTSVLGICVSNVSEAYTLALGWCAKYLGIKGDSTSYTINQEFIAKIAESGMVTAIVNAWQSGALRDSDMIRALQKLDLIDPGDSPDEVIDTLRNQAPTMTGG